jgi:hypothetical protein
MRHRPNDLRVFKTKWSGQVFPQGDLSVCLPWVPLQPKLHAPKRFARACPAVYTCEVKSLKQGIPVAFETRRAGGIV